ncbi:MAG: hypothetical protein FWE67_09110 [Planctomycetaceae bacterium]|nr:hypothetical protein [Planctomycetaceae bacterium]
MKELLKKFIPGFLMRRWHYFGKRYFRYHYETVSVAGVLSKETGISFLLLLLDMNLSILQFVKPDEYKNYRFYDKSRNARAKFLTIYRLREMVWAFNSKDTSFAQNKQMFNRHFSNFLGRQWLYAPDVSDQQIEGFLRTQKQIIVKPNNISSGTGVQKISYSEVDNIKAFCEEARKDCLLLEEVVEQHPDLSSINSASVNTTRINTVMDKAGVPHILCAALRMGTGQSVVDLLSTILLPAESLHKLIWIPVFFLHQRQAKTFGPISNIRPVEPLYPAFKSLIGKPPRKMVLQAAKAVPQIRWIAWDVAITEKGTLLIEGNIAAPCPMVMQIASQTGVYHIMRSYL